MSAAAVFRELAQLAGPAAIAALWQGIALALGLAVCLRLAPRASAADRFKVWAAGFAALAAVPFLPLLFTLFQPVAVAGGGAAGALPAGAAPHPWIELDLRWSVAIAAVWMVASLARAVDLGMHALRLRRLWRNARPIEVNALSGEPGMSVLARRVQVCATRDLDRPSVIGFFAPRILIPEWLLERLSAAELEQVVLHEAEHLRRRDDWTNLLQKLCLVVFPLNPALAWMERRLCREREIACDEGVVRQTRAPRAYAACLASLAERGLELRIARRMEALSLGAWRRRPEVVDRVHRILRRSPALHPAAARALLGLVGCGLVFGSVELARCPRLVAFEAPSPAKIAALQAAPGLASASYLADGQSLSGFHAVETVAHVPSRAELAAARKPARAVDRVKWSPTLATERTRENGARSMEASAAKSGPIAVNKTQMDETQTTREVQTAAVMRTAPQQQWIVFTEWEQVETAGKVSRDIVQYAAEVEPAGRAAHHAVYGDLVMSEPDGRAGTPGASAAPRAASRFTITRLILRIYPADEEMGAAIKGSAVQAGATKATATKTATGSNPVLKSGQLPAAPVRDGWLVIQL